MFSSCAIYYKSNISIEEEHQVFFWSVVNFPDNYRRYCGDSHLPYYDLTPFVLLQTPGFSELLWAPSPRPPPRFCPGDLTALPQTPSWQGQWPLHVVRTAWHHPYPTNFWWWWCWRGGGGGITWNFHKQKGDQQFFCFFQGESTI